jgi:hypothetical protein
LCHRSLQNQPLGVESKPATPRWSIHIGFLEAGKDFSVFSCDSGNGGWLRLV